MFTKCNRPTHSGFRQNSTTASFEEKLKRMRNVFHSQHQSFFGEFRSSGQYPVNIKETETSYEMYLFAPGLEKENFEINVQQDILTVTYKPKTQAENEQWMIREMVISAFERSFELKAEIIAESSKAHYENGVLHITLPKDPERIIPPQNVPVG